MATVLVDNLDLRRQFILKELAALTHRAGRMTVVSLGYEPTHGEINDLLDELELIDSLTRVFE